MQNKTDYIFYSDQSTTSSIINKKCKLNDYIDFKSITKLFVTFALAKLVNDGKLSYLDSISKDFPKYPYPKIKIINIIQHTSGLENKWSYIDKKTQKYVMYDVTKEYFNSKNRYNYVLGLKQVNQLGVVHYNNFAYDILGYIIKKVTGVYVDEYLRKIFFNPNGIKIIWSGNSQPYGGFGLGIRYGDLHKLTNLVAFLKEIKFKNMLTDNIIKVNQREFIGHSGSGGQYLYFSLRYDIVFLAVSCGEPDAKPLNEQLDKKDVVRIMGSMVVRKN